MVISLEWPSPAISSSLPAALPRLLMMGFGTGGVGHTSPPIWPCSDWGLPCHRCYQRRGGLLPHRFTLTLWIQGRSVLCGPVRRLSAPRRYLAVCPVELGLSSNGPCSRPPATIGPTTSRLGSYRPLGPAGKSYFAKRLITRPKLSVAAPSSQNPACSVNAANRRRDNSAGANVARAGSRPMAESAKTWRAR